MKRYLAYLLALALFIQIVPVSLAEDPTATPAPTTTSTPSNNNSEAKSDLERKKREYEEKLKQITKQKDTLASQIEYMDTQIYLTELTISETENKIMQTEKEITSLTKRIEGLDSSLDNLSHTLIDRVVDGYKQRQVTLFDIVLDSENAGDLLGKVKYQKKTQENNQKLLFQVQQAKSNFEDQKKLREKKIAQLNDLKDVLSTQRADLITQQDQKQQLLTVTRNDEGTYRRLIEDANRQIASFKSFVATTGVGAVGANSFGGGEGGWYMSQRDSRWAGMAMGNSSESILDVGCFISSIAMVMKFYGYDYTPVTLASDAKYFIGRSAWLYIPSTFNGSWPGGKNYHNISSSEISSYLDRNIPVIAGVQGSSHYIVLKKNSGDGYIMNDPIYGPDLKVSQYYSLSGPYGVFE